MAAHIATWSKDQSTQVGAVIADPEHRIVGVGFNGFPRGIADDERLLDRDKKLPVIIHAEINAVLNASRSVAGCTLYTYPISPCQPCASVVVQAGIVAVVAPSVLHPRLEASCRAAIALFEEAGVKVTIVDGS